MAQVRVQPSVALHAKMCRRCGFAGVSLQHDGPEAIFDCPNCGEDLYARPPMSYAEMEGFGPDRPLTVASAHTRVPAKRARSVATPAGPLRRLLAGLLRFVRR